MSEASESPSASTALDWGEWLARPSVIALLWILTTALHVIDQLSFPDFTEGSQYVSSVMYLASIPVLAAFAAAAIARLRSAALELAGALMLIWLVASLVWLAIEFSAEASGIETTWAEIVISIAGIAATIWATVRITGIGGVSRSRRWTAALVALFVLVAWEGIALLDDRLIRISAERASGDGDTEPPPDINEERLWTAQPALVQRALRQIPETSSGAPSTFVVAIAAGGSQLLFGREARKAEEVLGRSFNAEGRSVVLANDLNSLEKVPLATNTNLDAVLSGIAERMNRERDLLVIYLAAHGSKAAELITDLPDYSDIEALGAERLATSLRRANIPRRIIIISACYSGSWIKPLASDDTIVIAAARSDRTSFGCTDDRDLTYFGEAFLTGPIASGASLAQRLAATRRTVSKWEARESLTPSEPQAFVGKNMTEVWQGKAR